MYNKDHCTMEGYLSINADECNRIVRERRNDDSESKILGWKGEANQFKHGFLRLEQNVVSSVHMVSYK